MDNEWKEIELLFKILKNLIFINRQVLMLQKLKVLVLLLFGKDFNARLDIMEVTSCFRLMV